MLLFVLLAQTATADWLDEQRNVCIDHADFQRRVEACTWLLNAEDAAAQAKAAAHYFRAIAYTGLGRHELALSDATEALDRHPGNAAYHFFRAYVQANLRRLREAIADLDRALQLGFDKPAEAWGFRGELHMDLGEHEQAVLDAERSLSHAPGLRTASKLRDTALASLREQRCDEYETAAAEARTALDAGRHDVAQRQSEIALATFERTARFTSEHAAASAFACDTPRWSVLAGLGDARLARARHDEAAAAYRLALAAGEGADAQHAVAVALTRVAGLPAPLGQMALTAAERAATLEPGHEHLNTLAAAQAASGDFASAAESQRAAMELLDESDAERQSAYRERLQHYVEKAGEQPRHAAEPAQQAVAAVQLPSAAATTGGSLRDEAWVLAQPPGNFTVQLFASMDRERLLAELGRQALPGDTGTFGLSRDGQSWYAAVHGSFASRTQAAAAAESLSARLGKDDTWVRRFAEVHEAIRNR